MRLLLGRVCGCKCGVPRPQADPRGLSGQTAIIVECGGGGLDARQGQLIQSPGAALCRVLGAGAGGFPTVTRPSRDLCQYST